MKQKFKVFISGQKYFGQEILSLCLAKGYEVVGVCCPLDDKYIGRLAKLHNIPILPAGMLTYDTIWGRFRYNRSLIRLYRQANPLQNPLRVDRLPPKPFATTSRTFSYRVGYPYARHRNGRNCLLAQRGHR